MTLQQLYTLVFLDSGTNLSTEIWGIAVKPSFGFYSLLEKDPPYETEGRLTLWSRFAAVHAVQEEV